MAINMTLYRVPDIDPTYQHVPYFGNREEQTTWFNTQRLITVETNMSVDPSRTTATIDKPYSDLVNSGINYASIQDTSGKTIYYFISDFEYKTSNATTLILNVDVFQSYIHDLGYRDSFVERCHVDRYKTVEHVGSFPNCGTLDEGLEMGDMILSDVISAKFRDKYIIASTTPLGKNGWNRPSSGGGGGIQPLPTDGERMDAWRTICRGV